MMKNVFRIPPSKFKNLGKILAFCLLLTVIACNSQTDVLESSLQNELSVADKLLIETGEKSVQLAVGMIANNMSETNNPQELEKMALSEISKVLPNMVPQ